MGADVCRHDVGVDCMIFMTVGLLDMAQWRRLLLLHAFLFGEPGEMSMSALSTFSAVFWELKMSILLRMGSVSRDDKSRSFASPM